MLSPSVCPLLLAIDLPHPPAAPPRTLAVEEAARLVDIVAADLERLVPGVDRFGVALAGALYDQAQVLRPGWPLFATLAELYARQPRSNALPRLLGFGQSAGRMALPALEPELALGIGTLVVIPAVLIGDEDRVKRTAAWLEAELAERGGAGAAVALFVRDAWGLMTGHARYLTRHDLAALAALQLEHAGYAGAWSLIEAALLSPTQAQSALAASGQPWRYVGGQVRCGMLGLADFRALHPRGHGDEAGAAFEQWLVQQRQIVALLNAHGLAATFVTANAAALADPAVLDGAAPLPAHGLIERLDTPGLDPKHLLAHHAGRWGVVGYSVITQRSGAPRVLARGWPASAGVDAALRRALASEYAIDAVPSARERLATMLSAHSVRAASAG